MAASSPGFAPLRRTARSIAQPSPSTRRARVEGLPCGACGIIPTRPRLHPLQARARVRRRPPIEEPLRHRSVRRAQRRRERRLGLRLLWQDVPRRDGVEKVGRRRPQRRRRIPTAPTARTWAENTTLLLCNLTFSQSVGSLGLPGPALLGRMHRKAGRDKLPERGGCTTPRALGGALWGPPSTQDRHAKADNAPVLSGVLGLRLAFLLLLVVCGRRSRLRHLGPKQVFRDERADAAKATHLPPQAPSHRMTPSVKRTSLYPAVSEGRAQSERISGPLR